MSKSEPPDLITTPGPIVASKQSTLPRKRRRPGQPLKLTPVVQETICSAIKMGCPLTDAARCAGVSVESLHRWRRLAEEQGKEPFVSFLGAVELAEAELKQTLLKIMYEAAPTDYRAARDILRMRWPDEFGQRAERFDGGGVSFNIRINLDPEAVKKPAAIPIETTKELPPKDEPRN